MPDYGGPGGFGPGTTGGGEAATGRSSSSGATGPGGQTPGRGPGGQMMAGASPGDLSRATTEGFDTTRGFDQNVRDKGSFVERIKSEEDESNPIRLQDISRLYDELNKQNINPNQVSLKNFTQGPFAQKNVVMHQGKRIGQFGSVPAFGLSGFLANIAGLDLRNLQLDQSTFGEPDRGGRADERSVMEILYPSEETPMEEQPIEAQPVIPGYDLAFRDFYGQQLPTRGFQPMRNGGLASLPMNFNPMTNVNPFSMMMRGGR
jgi:hypothetical protein